MPWIVYAPDGGQEPEEIARASTPERAEAFGDIWEDEPALLPATPHPCLACHY